MNDRGGTRVSPDWGVVQRSVLVAVAAALAITLQMALDAAVGQLLFMTFCLVVLMFLAIVFRAERNLPLLCDPLVIVLAFMAQFFIIGAPALFVLDFFIFRPVTPERGVLVLGLFAVFISAFFLGYQIRFGQIVANMLPDFANFRRRMPWTWIETAVVLAGVLGCAAFIWSQGGVGKLMRLGYGRVDTKPIYQLAYHTLLAGTFLMAWRVDSRAKTSRAAWAPLVALILAEVVFFGIISGARKWLFYLFFGLVCMRLLRHGARGLQRTRFAAMLVTLVVFFSIWGTIRSHPLSELIGDSRADARVVARDPFHMGYFKSVSEPFEIASLVVDLYPSQRPYECGRTLLVTVFGFIPRSVWPDKPVGLGKTLTRYTDGLLFEHASGHSIAPTLVGDFYANLGIVGVVIGGVIFGLACRTIAAYAATGMVGGVQLNAARVIIPSVFVSGLAEVRGDSATMLAFYIMVLVPVVIACATSRLDPRPGLG